MEYKFRKFQYNKISEDESLEKGKEFYEVMKKRRSIRNFSPEKFDIGLIELAIKTAGTAPSGANKQP